MLVCFVKEIFNFSVYRVSVYIGRDGAREVLVILLPKILGFKDFTTTFLVKFGTL